VKAIDILCEHHAARTLPPDELAKELDVIRREMDMGQDDPAAAPAAASSRSLTPKAPIANTIIAISTIFNRIQPEDIRSYYTEKYAPNNVFFVVAGDVKNARSSPRSRPLRDHEIAAMPPVVCRSNRGRPANA